MLLGDGVGDGKDELLTLKRGLAYELGNLAHEEAKVLFGLLIQANDVARAQGKEISNVDAGPAEAYGAIHGRVVDLVGEHSSAGGAVASVRASEPLLGAELGSNGFEDEIRNAEAHSAPLISDLNLEEDGDNDIVGRGDLNELGARFHAFNAGIDDDDAFPGTLKSQEHSLDNLLD